MLLEYMKDISCEKNMGKQSGLHLVFINSLASPLHKGRDVFANALLSALLVCFLLLITGVEVADDSHSRNLTSV
jgi:hypothetical protein